MNTRCTNPDCKPRNHSTDTYHVDGQGMTYIEVWENGRIVKMIPIDEWDCPECGGRMEEIKELQGK